MFEPTLESFEQTKLYNTAGRVEAKLSEMTGSNILRDQIKEA